MLYCDLRNRICVATNSFCATGVIKMTKWADRLAAELCHNDVTEVNIQGMGRWVLVGGCKVFCSFRM